MSAAWVGVTLLVVAYAGAVRVSLARSLPWQGDEIPLLVRFTGLCGRVTNQSEASVFRPTLYTFRTGAVRALRAPTTVAALHTTTNFWTNLSVHLLGVSPFGGRVFPLLWSLLGVAAAAWAAWLVARTTPAACVAGLFVALSPAGTAYAAQARGYSEALALGLGLLVALELLRPRPRSYARAAFVLVVVLQSALTVYTMWVYWVLPAMLVSTCALPARRDDAGGRVLRARLVVITGLAVAVMAVFTMGRWASLSLTAREMGESLTTGADVLRFLGGAARELLPAPAWIAALALVGVANLARSPVRWWRWLFVAAVLVPTCFALARGSAGYVRNFVHLIGPMAVLVGTGAGALLAWVDGGRTGFRQTAALAVLVVGAIWSARGLEARAREVLPPDWGQAVLALQAEPEVDGPRWFLPCLANHWQINWYRAPRDDAALLDIPASRSIEIVLGATRDAAGVSTAFAEDPEWPSVRQIPLPAFLASVPATARSDVELRRWRGVRIGTEDLARVSPEAIVCALALDRSDSTAAWRGFLQSVRSEPRSILTFKGIGTSRGFLRSLVCTGAAARRVDAALQESMGTDVRDVAYFQLFPRAE
ncbi:MAG: hypothetical protein HY763_08975 [Planctomycetes bacterium]|nr:hypothetical protein [Planctomycetota bacterium]